MALATKLGVALLVALASNATLLSVLITRKNTPADGTTTTTDATTSNPAADNDYNDDGVPSWPSSSSRLSHAAELARAAVAADAAQKGYEDYDRKAYEGPRRGDIQIHHERRRVPPPPQAMTANKEDEEEEKRRARGPDEAEAEVAEGEEEGEEEVPPRSERSVLSRMDTGHHLDDVIATLTEAERKQLDEKTVKILLPALIALESVVLRELETLHDVSVHQELRLEKLEKNQMQGKEVMEAANVIREEHYLTQRKAQKDALEEQQGQQPTAQPSPTEAADVERTQEQTAAEVRDTSAEETPGASSAEDPMEGETGSGGSGDEALLVVDAAAVDGDLVVVAGVATTTTNYTESSDNAIINHIYEIYSSLTTMEHKVMELGTSLAVVSTELYRQRSTFVRLEDKVEDIRRNQRTLVMRSTMHGFKLSDLEQFKGQAEMLLRTVAGTVEQLDAKMEIFKDRVTAQQDDVRAIRATFGRMEQSATELRTADSYKAHDIQELKRNAQQVESRLSSLYHSLDRYIANIRWDVKTHLDHLCTNNNLNC